MKDDTEIKYSRFEKEDIYKEGDSVNIFWNPAKAVAIKTKK
jgi:spermidine/putrescine transport system ATP-binding protein